MTIWAPGGAGNSSSVVIGSVPRHWWSFSSTQLWRCPGKAIRPRPSSGQSNPTPAVVFLLILGDLFIVVGLMRGVGAARAGKTYRDKTSS
jgi:hypothetical protein